MSHGLRWKTLPGQAPEGRAHKFGVSAKEDRTLDGVVFDSKGEMAVWEQLKQVVDPRWRVVRQPRVLLQPGFRDRAGKWIRPVVYQADFLVTRSSTVAEDQLFESPADFADEDLLIDAKGMKTDVFLLKHKLYLFRFPEIPLVLHALKGKKGLARLIQELGPRSCCTVNSPSTASPCQSQKRPRRRKAVPSSA